MEPSTFALRALALLAVLVGLLQAFGVLAWYAGARLVTPPKTWHVVSVAIGWTLIQVFALIGLARTWIDVPLPPGLRACFALVGQAFVIYGTHQLFWAARRRERREGAGGSA